MYKIFLCLIYGVPAVAGAAWAAEMLHDSLAWGWTPACLAALNIVTFAVYAFDKGFAGLLDLFHVRVPVDLLIWGLAFPGGWLGAWAGVFLLHHKTSEAKVNFRLELLAAHAANVTLILLMLVTSGLSPAALMERADPVVARAVASVMVVTRAVLAAVRAAI